MKTTWQNKQDISSESHIRIVTDPYDVWYCYYTDVDFLPILQIS